MSGWNEGGRSDKGNEEEKKKTQCLTGILNCKGLAFQQITNFSRPFQLDQIWGTTTAANDLKVGKNWQLAI